MTHDTEASQERLRAILEQRRLMNDRLTELVDDEVERREQAYGRSEGISGGQDGPTNMHLVATLFVSLEQDHDLREDVDAAISAAETPTTVTPDSAAMVERAIVERIENLDAELGREATDGIVGILSGDFDTTFLD